MTLSYNIGDQFWMVTKNINFDSKKIRMTDSEGVDWYRYVEPKNRYEVQSFKIVGKLTITVEGYSLWDDNDYKDHYSIQFEDGDYDSIWEEDMHPEAYYRRVFKTQEEALSYVEADKAKE